MNGSNPDRADEESHIMLGSFAASVLEARAAVDAARASVARDKRSRLTSLVARLRDFFTATPAELSLKLAKDKLVVAEREAAIAANAWVLHEARRLLAKAPDDVEKRNAHRARLNALRLREAKVARWADLAEQALNALQVAESACRSASSYEVLDAVSSSTAISAVSTMTTASASSRLSEAREAVKDLADELPKRSPGGPEGTPDDVLDLAVDLIFDFGFDLLSFMNVARLNTAASKCEEVAREIEKIKERIDRAAATVRKQLEEELAALRVVEGPYLEEATRRIPSAITIAAPKGLG